MRAKFSLKCKSLVFLKPITGTSGETIVANLFKFKMVNRVRCTECHGVSVREEEYMGLPITVQGCATLHQALARACANEPFTGANLYRCTMGCDNRKTEAARASAFRSLPEVMLMNLNRFTWNEYGDRVKLTHRCAFPISVDMRPYLEEQLPIAEVAAGTVQPACPAYRAVAGAVVAGSGSGGSGSGSDEVAVVSMSAAIAAAAASKKGKKTDKKPESERVAALEEAVELDESSPHIYDLFAVLIHAGVEASVFPPFYSAQYIRLFHNFFSVFFYFLSTSNGRHGARRPLHGQDS